MFETHSFSVWALELTDVFVFEMGAGISTSACSLRGEMAGVMVDDTETRRNGKPARTLPGLGGLVWSG
jgi:hypothetical protein